MANTLEDAAWGGDPEALRQFREQAAKETDKTAKAAILLNAHVTQLSNLRSGALGKKGVLKVLGMAESMVFGELAARYLQRQFVTLDHGQLSMLASWQVQVAKRLPWRVPVAQEIARAALRKSIEQQAGPHEIALAYAVKAQALWLPKGKITTTDRTDLAHCLEQAVSYEDEIRALPDPVYGLRQHVRALRLVGEIQMDLGDHRQARWLWHRALALAEGKANTESQATQLRRLLISH